MRRRLAAVAVALAAALAHGPAAALDPTDWPSVLDDARGQTVEFYAWGGETHINDYISWVGEMVAERHGVTVRQVKLADTAEAVARVLAEKAAGADEGGAVDLVWINGENFVAMQSAGLLRPEPWAKELPNRALVDMARFGDAITTDFGVPVEGQQSPWGRAQLVMIFDAARTPEPPRSLDALLKWVEANPGRFTYPRPPNFTGTTFLKQVLIDSVPDRALLDAPAGPDAAAFVEAHMLPPLRSMEPYLWRAGRAFPANVAELRALYADGELDLALTGNPSDALAGVRAGLLPPASAVTAFEGGSIGNVHFVAIPYNAADAAGAMVVANFLLSPEAQARKADPDVWGDPSVLEPKHVDGALAGASVDAPTLSEPHASWTAIIEDVWQTAFLE